MCLQASCRVLGFACHIPGQYLPGDAIDLACAAVQEASSPIYKYIHIYTISEHKLYIYIQP